MVVKIASAMIPVVNDPEISRKYPKRNGPPNPPISAAEKNIPPARPILRAPIPRVSINISVDIGISGTRTITDRKTLAIKTGPEKKASPAVVAQQNKINAPRINLRRPSIARRGMNRRPKTPEPVARAVSDPASETP